MSSYPPADTKTQWYQDNFPGATMNLTAATTVLVLHTTETSGWPGYLNGADAPTYTAMPRIGHKGLDWRQHFPDEKSARALENRPGGVETNAANCIQVELVGTCDPRHAVSWQGVGKAGVDYIYWPDAPVWLLAKLADFVFYLNQRHGLALTAAKFIAYPASYGPSNGVRLTGSQWQKFTGICGHQHVPENDHGDPGNINVDALLSLVKAKFPPAPAPAPAPTPTTKRIPRRSVEHPATGHPEYEGDSRRAADHAVATGKAAIDYNVLLDENATPINAHYGLPLRHGFEDPKGLVHRDTPLHQMGIAEWGRLQTVKGTPPYVIRPMAQRIDYAVAKGLIVEADLKCDVPAEVLRTLLRNDSVQFKTMATLNDADPRVGRPWVRLQHAKQAGGTTILLCHRPFLKVPKEYAQFIDFYRGFKPHWV